MKKLFIYYSYTGNGDIVGEYLKNKGIEVRKVKSKYRLSKILFFAMMKGGFHALIKKKPKLIDFDSNIESYDEIIIGIPIWNDRIAPVMNTVLDELDLNNKKIIFILYSGSGSCNTAKNELSIRYKDSKIINLKEPKKYKEELEKVGFIYE